MVTTVLILSEIVYIGNLSFLGENVIDGKFPVQL